VVICLKQGANDLHMVKLSHCHPSSLASLKARTVYLSGAGLPGCPGKEAIKWM